MSLVNDGSSFGGRLIVPRGLDPLQNGLSVDVAEEVSIYAVAFTPKASNLPAPFFSLGSRRPSSASPHRTGARTCRTSALRSVPDTA
jgi:hypothetical protein